MPDLLPIQNNFPLAALNSFGLPAHALHYLRVEDPAQLQAVRSDARLSSLPRLVLGGGSNLVLAHDFNGLVLHMANRGIAFEDRGDFVLATAAAGENWHGFVQATLAQGLGGLENLSLIPGSVGASPIQNIGAYGVEVKDCFHSLQLFDMASGQARTLTAGDCRFAYRDSIFKHELAGAVILEVSFALPRRWQARLDYAELANELKLKEIKLNDLTPRRVADAVVSIRSRKLPDPGQVGNAGSFFKNPVVSAAQRETLAQSWPNLVAYSQPDGSAKLAAGWLIDQCGWKGKSLGRAGVYEKQALVLVNRGGATGEDVLQLARAIQDDVRARFGVELEMEPVVV
jgi:UDP-N-acetylmuramate dehydrogenase